MHIFIIDAGCKLHGVGGSLNHHYADMAKSILQEQGHSVEITRIDEGYDITKERIKILDADIVILQTPGWWMSTPWQYKQYEDLVYGNDMLIYGDGRSRNNPNLKYGSGGKLLNKRYMISTTWNAPKEAFEDPSQFFEGVGIDGVLFGVHKTFQFLGMQKLPTFMANDVLKNPTHEADFARFKAHLLANIK